MYHQVCAVMLALVSGLIVAVEPVNPAPGPAPAVVSPTLATVNGVSLTLREIENSLLKK